MLIIWIVIVNDYMGITCLVWLCDWWWVWL